MSTAPRVLHLTGPCLVVAVGPVAAGKSTVLDSLRRTCVLDQVVSTDAIRAAEGLPPSETDRTFALAYAAVLDGLAHHGVIALDATNVLPSDRVPARQVARQAGADVVALRIGAGLTVADLVARDASRSRHVPRGAIVEKHREFAAHASVEALLAEGFTAVAEPRDALVRCRGCTLEVAHVGATVRISAGQRAT